MNELDGCRSVVINKAEVFVTGAHCYLSVRFSWLVPAVCACRIDTGSLKCIHCRYLTTFDLK